ncbi:hypothetical protein [Roseinatronobacter ekhonensis]|uniref:hypothetical protein n=1 Tax=Roseinatronobacter ekhonensis TaxID=254356 RepID=UPI0011C44A73|nr:hypothetical protein [Roseibaca ekhonensis]
METAVDRRLSLDFVTDDAGYARPWNIHFTEDARSPLNDFRKTVREWEAGAEGLMLSIAGKFPGMMIHLRASAFFPKRVGHR